jgi:hypothetical protein
MILSQKQMKQSLVTACFIVEPESNSHLNLQWTWTSHLQKVYFSSRR